MPGERNTESDPAVRISFGSHTLSEGRELCQAATDAAPAVPMAAVGSTGHQGLEPLVMATRNGETAFFSRCSIEQTRTVVDALDGGDLPTADALAVTTHDPGTARLPVPEDGPLSVGDRRVLSTCGWAVPDNVEDHHAAGLSVPIDIEESVALSRLRASSLRGRGRGDASTDTPVADTWTTVSETDGEPVVVVNANEADGHATGDELLLESAPLSVLEPALATAAALDATAVAVYLNETMTLARERVQAAANALNGDGGDGGEGVPIRVVEGPDEYKAGEPTMALEAIEGNHRLEARRQPPGPSEYGLDGRPTVVHTPRTMAQIGPCLAGDDLGGASSDPGTRLFTVAGDVSAPATVELDTGATLETVVPAVEREDGHKASCVGGVFGGLTRSLDVPASAPGLASAGLGTNGVVELLGASTCVVALAGERARFARESNCGRCAPCREGSKQLVNLLRDVYDGEFEDGMLRELGRTMRESSLCGFGRDASRPVTTAIEAFEPEFTAHAEGRCPSGTCSQL